MKKIRVGVLMGGKSAEKEVSLNSGRTVCDHLDSAIYEVVPLFQNQFGALFILPFRFLHRGKISDFEHRLTPADAVAWDDLKSVVDFVYIAQHGRYGEDGALQGLLEILKIPYCGSKVFASAVGMDKIVQKDFLRQHGIAVANDLVVLAGDIGQLSVDVIVERMQEKGVTFPCVVKPHKEGSSIGICVVQNKEDLLKAVECASSVNHAQKQAVLIENKIEGMEFTCTILTNHQTGGFILLPPTEIVYEKGAFFYDYEQKYMPGRAIKFTPARCDARAFEKIQEVCLKTMRILEFKTIARIDGFLTSDGQVIIIDPNSFTGMAPSSAVFNQGACVGMNHAQLINHLIKTELHQYNMVQE